MPQIEKLGKASATNTVTSQPGSSCRARRAAVMPASLPPTTTRCFPGTAAQCSRPEEPAAASTTTSTGGRSVCRVEGDHQNQAHGGTDDLGTDVERDGARVIPAKVSVNTRPTVTAGFANEVELVYQ